MNGRVDNMPFLEYCAVPAVSFTRGLKPLGKSVAHYLAPYDDGDTPARRMGRAVHCRILEPTRFNELYQCVDCEDRRTKLWKDAEAVWAKEGKELLKRSEADICYACYESTANHPRISQLFEEGDAEVSLFWTDVVTGLACKCRIDWLRPDGIIIDLKTAATAEPSEFARYAARFEYWIQAAWYRDGAIACGIPVEHCLMLPLELEPPYAVSWARWDDAALLAGRQEYTRRLASLAAYYALPEAERWAGYPTEVQTLSLPTWITKED
ncbi:MAG: hypothetical protein A3G75_13570 [Verrucomicrobia bacterium RIFCSPLOWO2_12_FULL_64_8]|nr:MAG: hypothetical protein A3G75_13570 [Verrucomicrobia bacterium RIFCSPLOWO2_12_FULL_64_8]